jgi:hypothetical protein
MKPTIRCSGLDQLFACPGSRVLQALVKPHEGEEAQEGKFVHWAIAHRLVAELGAWEPAGGLGPCPVDDGPKRFRMADWITDFCVREAMQINRDWSMEVEVPLAYEFDSFILSGHLDLFAANQEATAAEGMDWKAGYLAVDPADCNEQFGGYLALMKLAYPGLDRARFTCVQPRNNEDEGDQRVSSVQIGGSDFEAIISRLQRKVEDALSRSDEVETGLTQCRYCDADLQCPAIHREFDSMKAKLTPETLARIKAEPDDALLGDLVISAKILEGPCEHATAILYERLDAKGGITAGNGTRIAQVKSPGMYEVIAPLPMYEAVCSTLPPEAVANVVSYSTTKLRDACAKHFGIPKGGNAEVTAAKLFDQRFRPHLRQGERRTLKLI